MKTHSEMNSSDLFLLLVVIVFVVVFFVIVVAVVIVVVAFGGGFFPRLRGFWENVRSFISRLRFFFFFSGN